MPHKDPEKSKQYKKDWYNKNKKRISKKAAQYYKDNKDKYFTDEKIEKRLAWKKTPAGIKSNTISSWKAQGLIHDDYNKLYNDYDKAWFCGICLTDFKDSHDKCMDHDHETGLFREFLCRSCNTMDHWKKVLEQY